MNDKSVKLALRLIAAAVLLTTLGCDGDNVPSTSNTGTISNEPPPTTGASTPSATGSAAPVGDADLASYLELTQTTNSLLVTMRLKNNSDLTVEVPATWELQVYRASWETVGYVPFVGENVHELCADLADCEIAPAQIFAEPGQTIERSATTVSLPAGTYRAWVPISGGGLSQTSVEINR